jgi:hypothetical protein
MNFRNYIFFNYKLSHVAKISLKMNAKTKKTVLYSCNFCEKRENPCKVDIFGFSKGEVKLL